MQRRIDPISWLINAVRSTGLEKVFHRYYGVYRAVVLDVNDPEKRGRVRLICPVLGHINEQHVPEDYWAEPSFPGAGTGNSQTHGIFVPPEKDDGVWVMFEHGSPEYPVYFGGWWRRDHDAEAFKNDPPLKRGWKTRSGHTLSFDDSEDNLSITVSAGDGSGGARGSYVSLLGDGGVVISNTSGGIVSLATDGSSVMTAPDGSMLACGEGAASMTNSSGTTIAIDGDSISLIATGDVVVNCDQFYAKAGTVRLGDGASVPVALGSALVRWLVSHIHTAAGPTAPTTPPTVPPPVPNSELSTSVFVK